MSSEYHVSFIRFGKVEENSCHQAEEAINELAKGCEEVVSITPYTLVGAAKPMMNEAGQLCAVPPQLICGFVIVTKHLDPVEVN